MKGIDPDNVDGFDGHDTGFPLTANTAVEYMTFLASEAHSRNMSIGLKNAGSIVSRTLNMMQWEINEVRPVGTAGLVCKLTLF